jgi:hypothetical protein
MSRGEQPAVSRSASITSGAAFQMFRPPKNGSSGHSGLRPEQVQDVVRGHAVGDAGVKVHAISGRGMTMPVPSSAVA